MKTSPFLRLACLSLLGLTACNTLSTRIAESVPTSARLLLQEDFTTGGSLDRFTFSDEEAWRYGMNEEPVAGGGEPPRTYMALHKSSQFKPPYRSPLSYALVKDLTLTDFELQFEVAQTGRNYAHRDLCFFFGYVDEAHYYYVHLATQPDPNAHNVFLVDGAARRPLCPVPEAGIDWGEPGQWHTISLKRMGSEGHLQVFFDGEMTHEASDATLPAGRIGFGSFDDTGRIRQLLVWDPTPN
jgi:hypothetical protein